MSPENNASERDLTDEIPSGYIIYFTFGTHVHVEDVDRDGEWVAGWHEDGSSSVYNKNFVLAIEEEYEDEGDEETRTRFEEIVKGIDGD
jgi:hypothetical protein